MKKKIVGMFVCMLMLSTFVSIARSAYLEKDIDSGDSVELQTAGEVPFDESHELQAIRKSIPPQTFDPELEVTPMNIYLGTYSVDTPEYIEYTYSVKNTGGSTLYWFIEEFVWWIGYITIGGLQGYSGTCSAGETKEFTIHVATDWLDAPMPNVNVYVGHINISSNGGDVSTRVTIGMLDAIEGEEECPFDIQPGDILFMEVRQFWQDLFDLPSNNGDHNDHVAMYIGLNRFIESCDYTAWGGGYLDGVQISPWWWMNVVYCNFTVGRVVSATPTKILETLGFSICQIGETYQHTYSGYEPYHSWHANPDINDPQSPYYYPDDPYIEYWYCTELVWASYLHQGINIDATPNPGPSGHYFVHPNDILCSSEIMLTL